jgi:hypothetical protein
MKVGFPFYYLQIGGEAFSKRYIWIGLIGNFLVAFVLSSLIGTICYFITRKVFATSATKKD